MVVKMRCPMCGGRMVKCGWIKPIRSKGRTYGKKIVYRCIRCGYRTIR